MALYTSVDMTFHSKLFNENGSKIHVNVRIDEKKLVNPWGYEPLTSSNLKSSGHSASDKIRAASLDLGSSTEVKRNEVENA